MVFQNYALYPHKTVADNMGFALKLRRHAQVRDRRPCQARRRDPRPRALPRPLSAPALRRPAPARRHGPRHRPRSGRVPVRRAAVEPRRQAAGADARRDQGVASAAQDDDRLRHPRPGRGHDHGRPHRRLEQRRHRAGRNTTRALRPAGQHLRRRLHRLAGHEPLEGHDPRQWQPGLHDRGRHDAPLSERARGYGLPSRRSTAFGPSISC